MFKSRSQEKGGTPCVSLHGEKWSFLGGSSKCLYWSGYMVSSQLQGNLGKNVSGSCSICCEVDFDSKKDWHFCMFWCGYFEKNFFLTRPTPHITITVFKLVIHHSLCLLMHACTEWRFSIVLGNGLTLFTFIWILPFLLST